MRELEPLRKVDKEYLSAIMDGIGYRGFNPKDPVGFLELIANRSPADRKMVERDLENILWLVRTA